MSRLINADALWMDIIHSMDYCDDILEIIERQPTIEERKAGRWEITNLGTVGVFDSCSECKRVVKHKAPFYNYCPNCGADMRGEQDE